MSLEIIEISDSELRELIIDHVEKTTGREAYRPPYSKQAVEFLAVKTHDPDTVRLSANVHTKERNKRERPSPDAPAICTDEAAADNVKAALQNLHAQIKKACEIGLSVDVSHSLQELRASEAFAKRTTYPYIVAKITKVL